MNELMDHMDHNGSGGLVILDSKRPLSCYWSFTYFIEMDQMDHMDHPVSDCGSADMGDPISQVDLLLGILKPDVKWYVAQLETCPETGRIHLQGTLCFLTRKRLSGCKRYHPKVHWEITKCISASVAYCSKKETSRGLIWTHGIELPEEVKVAEPRGWQLQVLDIIKSEPDDRTIHWFWEPAGGVGKSTLCKYLVVKHDALVVSGKSTDMFHAILKYKVKHKRGPKLVIVDCPRSSLDYFNYGAIEQIKNGLLFSGKYDGDMCVFNTPHVITFANTPPNWDMMSRDRWHVVRIEA